MKTTYKTSKKYKCPFCDLKATRSELIDHVNHKHEDFIPEDYTAARCVYDYINGKNYGTCMICKAKVYEWNSKINRYYNLCSSPACKAKVREIALARHVKVYNKPTLLDDPEQQEKMLANRKISGNYVFIDGGKVTYTGQYEKKALEFIDKVLNIPSKDIQAPGPVLEYEYNGKKHKWITDIYYIPANLLIEIKDGGSNPNNRSMESYREKQIAKEKMITELGTFNYIRLTDNNFAQLLDIFVDMKNEALIEEDPSVKIHINEEVGGLPANRPPEAYIIPYGMNNMFSGYAYTDSETDKIFTISSSDDIVPMDHDKFYSMYETADKLFYTGKDIKEKMDSIHTFIRENKRVYSSLFFAEALIGKMMRNYEDILVSESFKYYSEEREKTICSLIESGVAHSIKEKDTNFKYANEKVSFDEIPIETIGYVKICRTPTGFYAVTPSDFYLMSAYFSDIESLKSSNVIDIMNDTYKNHFAKEVINNGIDF